jgi:hypothetical protein
VTTLPVRFEAPAAVDASSVEIVGDITNVQVIATGRGIRRLKTLRKRHGGRRWRKLKGDATPAVRRTDWQLCDGL